MWGLSNVRLLQDLGTEVACFSCSSESQLWQDSNTRSHGLGSPCCCGGSQLTGTLSDITILFSMQHWVLFSMQYLDPSYRANRLKCLTRQHSIHVAQSWFLSAQFFFLLSLSFSLFLFLFLFFFFSLSLSFSKDLQRQCQNLCGCCITVP